jgi:diguanylate cyclase
VDFSEILSPTVAFWSLMNVVVGIVAGFVIGRSYTLLKEPARLKEDRKRTLSALTKLLESTEQFNFDVGSHNVELNSVRQSVSKQFSGELDCAQKVLIDQISAVVEANRKMENDLLITQYQLEEQAQEIDRSRREARTDELSGLENRKAFDERLEYLITRFHAKNIPFGLLLCDVDHFKRINDTFGHQAGDGVVKSIGNVLVDCVRPKDHVARYGGDEFSILLDGVDFESARDIAGRTREQVENITFSLDGENAGLAVTLSMGLTVVHSDDSVDSIISRADKALYRSKKFGRNQLHWWTAENELQRSLD